MLKIYKSPEAENNLDEIWLYIAQDNPGCADKLLDEIEETSRKLARFPELNRDAPQLIGKTSNVTIYLNIPKPC
jgi:toxin ParE1/3/4